MNFQFSFNVQGMLQTLPVMLSGMVGGMLVMLLISGALSALYAIGRRGKKKQKDA